MNLLIGADPEIWIKDKTTGKLISAAGLLPGTKENPHKVLHGAVQVDGMAAEFNVNPCKSQNEFVAKVLSVLYELREIIQERNPDLKFEFVFDPVAEFGAEYIAAQSEETRRLGCDPDFNAWNDGAVNPTPDADMPFRTASGHIHLGWGSDYDITDPEHIEACCMMAKQLDCAVLPYVAQIEGKDGYRRRELYGKAGAFRPKPYGMEYRSPSNVWLRDTHYIGNMFYYTEIAFKGLLNGGKNYNNKSYQNMIKAIDKGNIDTVRDYCGPWYRANTVTTTKLASMATEWCQYAGIECPVKEEKVEKKLRGKKANMIIDSDLIAVGFDEAV